MSDLLLLTIVVVIYLFSIAWLAWYGYRRTTNAVDYLVAGRSVNPFVMALSYGATFISTAAIVGFGGMAARLGMGLLWLTFLNILFGIIIAFLIFGKRTRRIGHNLDAHTFPELLGKRFESPFLQGFSGLIIFAFMPLYAAAVLIGAARFIETAFGDTIGFEVALLIYILIVCAYVLAGGIKAVMYTEALQGGLMLFGMVVLLARTYWLLGGVREAHESLAAMTDLVPAALVEQGHRGWLSMPATGSPLWWTMVSTIIAGVGIGVLAQPQLAVRFMTVSSGRQINRAVGVGGIFIFVMTGFVYIVGALTNVYFHEQVGQIAIDAAGGNSDRVVPLYIESAMPRWFVFLFMLTLLSAAMSTSSSQLHAIGTSLGRDIFERCLMRGRHATSTVAVTRLGVIVGVVLTVWLGFELPGSIVAIATAVFFGLCASAFLPAYMGALFWRGMTRAGATASVVFGCVGTAFWLLFIHASEARAFGLCAWLFGRETLLPYPWTHVDPIFVVCPISCIVAVAVSLVTRRPADAHLELCFRYMQPGEETAAPTTAPAAASASSACD